MFDSINAAFTRAKNTISEQAFIVESVLDEADLEIEEVTPGSEEELDDEVDVDSVPDDVYAKIDKVIDKYVSSKNYDDTEAEELVDDDDYDVDEVSDDEVNAIITEAVSLWEGSSEETDSEEEEEDEDNSEDSDEDEDLPNDDIEDDITDDDDDIEEPEDTDEGDVEVSDKELEQDLDLNFDEAFNMF